MRQSPRVRQLAGVSAVLMTVTLLTGCGLLGSSSDTPASSGALEKSTIKVGVFPVVDSAPLYLAMDNGYFKAEGLDVTPVQAAGGPDVVLKLVSGDLDIGISSYPAFFAAEVKQAAHLKIVSDACQACDGHARLMVKKGSPITKPADLISKKVAVSGRGTISDLAASSVLATYGLDPSTVQWPEVRFTDMLANLQNGNVDAAVFAEPFVTQAFQSKGVSALFDIASGPTNEIALSGWGATDTFATANPKTVAAFQRAMGRAVADAGDRGRVEPVFTTKLKMDDQVAKLVTICTYPRTLEPVRIQRVADLMAQFHVIPKREPSVPGQRLAELDVTPLLLPPPPPASWATSGK
jgi:NitT/TauT family transport system substrate-binding protein